MILYVLITAGMKKAERWSLALSSVSSVSYMSSLPPIFLKTVLSEAAGSISLLFHYLFGDGKLTHWSTFQVDYRLLCLPLEVLPLEGRECSKGQGGLHRTGEAWAVARGQGW